MKTAKHFARGLCAFATITAMPVHAEPEAVSASYDPATTALLGSKLCTPVKWLEINGTDLRIIASGRRDVSASLSTAFQNDLTFDHVSRKGEELLAVATLHKTVNGRDQDQTVRFHADLDGGCISRFAFTPSLNF